MFGDIARRASVSMLLACSLSILAGCTGLISEKPIFGAADYDTSGSLLGHYDKVGENKRILVTRGPEGRIVLLVFDVKQPVPANTSGADAQTNSHEVLVQEIYAEASAVALGSGDFVLQTSCAALIHDGKVYGSWLGGKNAPYRNYTAYGFIAQDRKKDHLWASGNFFSGGDDASLIFNRYAIEKAPKNASKDYDLRIIPSDISRPTATALFRDLIGLNMNAGGGSDLYHRTDRDPQPTDDESAAVVLRNSEQCHDVQNEGEPPPK